SEARLRVEVQSGGPPFRAEARTPERTRESGRGLMLIERVADRWGMEPRDGVQMWFEIDL
ncbi:MAG TPA: ATP-binding protein, partial [Actinomycetota bacterium]